MKLSLLLEVSLPVIAEQLSHHDPLSPEEKCDELVPDEKKEQRF